MTTIVDSLVFRTGLRAKNRAWLAPMTNQQSHADGTLSDDELHWLERRAHGGFGVIETCAAHVSRDGQGWSGELGVWGDHQLPGLTRLAAMISAAGAIGIVQTFHGGLRADPALTGMPPWTASAQGAARGATRDDLTRVVREFRDAAVRAHRAGFHGVELHGAHGYLFTQFLSTTMNRRDDDYGGTLENRARLLREAMRATRAAVPAAFLVGVRLSPEDFGNAVGIDLDESLQVARWLCEDGADFIHVSLWKWQRMTTKRPSEHAATLFRAAVPADVTVVAAGGVWTRGDADALLARGADAVAVGRAAIANPEWATRVADSAWEPRRPPLTRAELHERGLSPAFAEYMRAWKNFVAD